MDLTGSKVYCLIYWKTQMKNRQCELMIDELEDVHAADAIDAARYRWLVGARTKEQTESVSTTVFNPLPQDLLISELQCFYLYKEQVDAAIDHARKAEEAQT